MADNQHEVIYIGDPMCSWCWGVCPTIKILQKYCTEQGLAFKIIVGGLRPNTGQVWNDEFKNFLRTHWKNVNRLTGQKFEYKLFENENFDYNTEPACRAVITVKECLKNQDNNNYKLYKFFAAIQEKFYVDNEDPSTLEFYDSLCELINLDFEDFIAYFESDATKNKTQQDFALSRSWGVNSFPSILFRDNEKLSIIASGYVTSEDMIAIIKNLVAK